MPYVCTGKYIADGKRYGYGETVNVGNVTPPALGMLLRAGILRQVSDADALDFKKAVEKTESVNKLRNLTRAYAQAKLALNSLSSELALMERNVVELRKRVEAAKAAERKCSDDLAAHSKTSPAAVAVVALADAPRVAPPAPAEPPAPVVTEEEERRTILSSVFAKSRGDLVAYARLKPSEGGSADGPFDLSKLRKMPKEEVQEAFVSAVMAARKAKLKA